MLHRRLALVRHNRARRLLREAKRRRLEITPGVLERVGFAEFVGEGVSYTEMREIMETAMELHGRNGDGHRTRRLSKGEVRQVVVEMVEADDTVTLAMIRSRLKRTGSLPMTQAEVGMFVTEIRKDLGIPYVHRHVGRRPKGPRPARNLPKSLAFRTATEFLRRHPDATNDEAWVHYLESVEEPTVTPASFSTYCSEARRMLGLRPPSRRSREATGPRRVWLTEARLHEIATAAAVATIELLGERDLILDEAWGARHELAAEVAESVVGAEREEPQWLGGR